jgi:predicted tellurium resistance membrane protein TerC
VSTTTWDQACCSPALLVASTAALYQPIFGTPLKWVVVLALAFLMLIGTPLIAEGFGAHVPRGYVYAAMAFSAGVEILNILARRRVQRRSAQL